MRRKIIKQGHQAYTVTLPIKWIRENNVDQEIILKEQDNSLIITPEKTSKTVLSEISLDLQDFSKTIIKNLIFQPYRKGFDKITLNFNNKEQLKQIQETSKTLLGFGIIEKTENKVILQNIAEPSSEQYEIILRRVFLQIKEESKTMLESIKEKNNLLPNFEEQDIEIRKYTNYLRRVIIRNQVGGRRQSYMLFLLVSTLSYIHQAYLFLYKAFFQEPKVISKETLDIFNQVNTLFNALYESNYKKDLVKVVSIIDAKKNLIEKVIYNQLKISKGIENIILYHLGEIVRLIQYGSNAALFQLLDYDNDQDSSKS